MTDDQRPGRAVATVAAVRSFPVKSTAAQAVSVIDVDAAGVRDDRSFAVMDTDGTVVTAAQAPQLRRLVAGSSSGAVWITDGSAGDRLTGTAADAALSALLGRAVRLVAVDPAGQLDAPVHLVSRQAVEAALRGEHEVADCACSLEEPRANIELDLHEGTSGEGAWESAWVGRTLQVGEVLLRLHQRPGHCLGVYAEVVRPGRVQVGDVVREIGG